MSIPAITPYRVDAERALLGILIQAPQLADSCGVLPADLCPDHGHPEILGAIISLYETAGTVDPVLLSQELIKRDQLTRIGEQGHAGGVYLFELVQAGQAPGSVGFYAKIVRESSVRRRLHEIGQKLTRTATTQGDLDVVLDHASDLALSLGLVVDTPIEGNAPIPGLSLFSDFVDEPSPPHNWVIPGLLEHQDRVVLVADEGAGKSVLARQVCTLTAAGRHPFKPAQKIIPRRTLLVDLENPPDLVRRNLRGMVSMVRQDGLDLADRAWRWNKPEGMDLRGAADRALMTRVIELTRPDLIAIGPLYKASHGRSSDTYEIAAQELAFVFDQIRSRYGCALWIEHHMPKGDATGHRSGPIGSSYWMRWPEFGPVLKWAGDDEPGVYHVKRFRGDREERGWPDRLVKRAGRWPWTAQWDDVEVENRIYNAVDEETADRIRREREAREYDRRELSGPGPRNAPPEDRYWPERDSDVDGVSNPSSQTANAGRQPAPPGSGDPGGSPDTRDLAQGDSGGSDDSLPEPHPDYLEYGDDEPIF